MKKTTLFVALPLMLLASCKGGSNDESSLADFTAFDGKSFTLSSLEEELIANWTADGYYEGCKKLYFEGYDDSDALENLAENEDVKNIMKEQGEQFIYEMTHIHHLEYQDVIKIVEACDAWEENYYAISGSNYPSEGDGELQPIYFLHTWWMYDNWEYSGSGNYGWEDSDVGKRILLTLRDFNNSDYEIFSPAVYVEKGTYSSENCHFGGNAYISVEVQNKSNGKSAYAVYRYNMARKTFSNAEAFNVIEFYDWKEGMSSVRE